MRTTLDIDPRVLAAARGRVQAGVSPSIGAAVSDMALKGLEHRLDVSYGPTITLETGLLVLPEVEGHVITSEMVEAALADG